MLVRSRCCPELSAGVSSCGLLKPGSGSETLGGVHDRSSCTAFVGAELGLRLACALRVTRLLLLGPASGMVGIAGCGAEPWGPSKSVPLTCPSRQHTLCTLSAMHDAIEASPGATVAGHA